MTVRKLYPDEEVDHYNILVLWNFIAEKYPEEFAKYIADNGHDRVNDFDPIPEQHDGVKQAVVSVMVVLGVSIVLLMIAGVAV